MEGTMSEPNRFDRRFFVGENRITRIGDGALGGKAQGLAFFSEKLASRFSSGRFPALEISVPRTAVIATDFFDRFMEMNGLYDVACSDVPDDRMAHAFQQAQLPPALLGDLRALSEEAQQPLAVRSSSLLEDTMEQPFAGVYATKMLPNQAPSPDERFRRLVEAVKLIYASTFFKAAKTYVHSVERDITLEKMAVVIQEVVGARHGDRFYPHISGVARSFNYYPCGHGRPEDGVVSLALGLGKTIVDGGLSWSYCPAFPKSPPPFNNVRDLLYHTQTRFFAVNMGQVHHYDPLREEEYLIEGRLEEAEYDDTLRHLCSTVEPGTDRVVPGVGRQGARLLDFAPILHWNDIPLNDAVQALLVECTGLAGAPVELEFAVTLEEGGAPSRLGFLQVRPMVVSSEVVDLSDEQMNAGAVVVSSTKVLGNGVREDIRDIVYVRPEAFDPGATSRIALEVEQINAALSGKNRPYLLIGFGRWGTTDHWRGIPVIWSQISGARAIVEVERSGMETDLSQGSHFFHNLTSFQVYYYSIRNTDEAKVNWNWLQSLPEVTGTQFVRHVEAPSPLGIRVDGRTGRGLVCFHEER
jgi:hypothetical protein